MNRFKSLASTLLVAAVAMPALSMAQDHDDHHDDRRAEQRHDERGAEQRHDDRGVEPRHDERGAGPDHKWHKGDRIPAEYRDRHHEVGDWKAHHLRQPPRGYHWVNVNGDYVLAAVATGVIADMLLNQ
jgi:Ni/Co efflux regulator RcnB